MSRTESPAQHAAGTAVETVHRLAVELSHDLITLTDVEGRVVYASPSWRRLGWAPEELVGTPVIELIHPCDRARAATEIGAVAGGSEAHGVVARFRRADGSWGWFESNGTPILDDDGQVAYLLGAARDITEREELRSRLLDLDAVYRFADAVADAGSLDEVLATALDALLAATAADRASVLLADEEGVLRFRAWRGLSDAYRAATEGHSPWPADAVDPQPVLVADVAEAGFDEELERTVRSEGIAALAFVPLVHGGRLVGKFMLYHDDQHDWNDREVLLCKTIASHLASVTVRTRTREALEESSRQLETILHTVDESVTVQTPAGTLAYANEAAARYLGFPNVAELLAASRGELVGRFELLDPDGAPLPQDALPGPRALRGESASVTIRLRERETGEERWAVVRANPVFGPDGRPALAVGVMHDITAEMEIQQRERRALAEAEAANTRLELLLAATEQLAETVDYEETLRRVPTLVVPRIADACHVYLARDDGARLERVAHTHVDPELAATIGSLDPSYDTKADRRVPIVEVFRTGRPVHHATLRRRLKHASRAGEEERLDRIGTRSLIVLPLEAGGRRFGVLSVSSSEPGRHGDADFALVVELARRVSLALDAVALHRRAQDSLAQLEAVIAQLPLGVIIADGAGRLVMRNDEVERIWQRPVESGKPLSEYGSFSRVRGDGTPVTTDEWPLQRALGQGEVVIGERQDFRRADGSERTMEINAAPVRDDDGAIVAGVAVFSDVTDRRRAEERLRFLARASALLSGSLDWEQTLAAIAEIAVPAFAGYIVVDLLDEADELHCVVAAHADDDRSRLVRRLRDRYPPVLPTHPVQVALRTGEAVLLRDLQAHLDTMAHDERHARAIRRIANTSGIVAPLIARGRTLGTISLGTIAPQPQFDEADVEAVRELANRASLALDNARLFAEAQARAHAAEALEFVDDGVFLVDGAGIVRLWNPAAAASFARPPAEAVGRPVAELIRDWPSLRTRIPIASEPLASGSRAQTLPVDVGGEERWLSISAVRFPGGTVYAFRDLTEERLVEQMKSDFVSTVSHELRTPLAAIYGAALTLRRDDVDLGRPQEARLLDVIASEADRLARIVNDILWASRLESGRMSIAIERCDASAIAREVADALAPRLVTGVELDVAAPAGLPSVAADPDKLRQVLTNLLDNALKYSPDGGRIELEVSRSGGRIRFRVSDQGLGVPPAEQDRIFEKFFRLDPNLTRGVGGTGLGLYISRELVQRMEGRIWVDSDGRRGSSFFVELPVA
ncbi:MAG TPA: PAS domain S-box protein [Gaiellaceae bacterium]|nr:PAS domain S-box protein [Gaiellaceae bacterium]